MAFGGNPNQADRMEGIKPGPTAGESEISKKTEKKSHQTQVNHDKDCFESQGGVAQESNRRKEREESRRINGGPILVIDVLPVIVAEILQRRRVGRLGVRANPGAEEFPLPKIAVHVIGRRRGEQAKAQNCRDAENPKPLKVGGRMQDYYGSINFVFIKNTSVPWKTV